MTDFSRGVVMTMSQRFRLAVLVLTVNFPALLPLAAQQTPAEPDSLVLRLVHHHRVHEELELSSEQQEEIRAIPVPVKNVSRGNDPQIIRQLIEGKASLASPYTEILLPHQLKQFAQVELQGRLKGAAFGLQNPAVRAELELTGQQVTDIQDAVAEYQRKRQELIDQAQQKIADRERALLREMFGKLTMQQQELYQQFLGPIE